MKKLKLTDLLIGILFTLFFISIGVILVINFRLLYRLDIDWLGIDVSSGMTKDIIMDNYNALIDYCSPFFKGELVFPTLASSESGLFHFKEVKDIFIAFYMLAPITAVLLVPLVLYKRKKQDFGYLKVSSFTCIILPVVVALACMINFDKTFVIFHKLFFNNDYWLFDWRTDPIILLLPEEFFLHCAICIVAIVILGSISLFAIYRRLNKNRSTK